MNALTSPAGKLDPEFKAKWIAALRSGEFRQSGDRLHRDDGYCCLGVACEVAGVDFYPLDFFPAKPVLDEWGLAYAEATRLADMNDGCGAYDTSHSFTEIADYIEENL